MTPRTRSLTGCSTCRSRHLKCDEARPGCGLCLTLGSPCPGYQGQLKWTQYAHLKPNSQHKEDSSDRVFRRPLLEENEQEMMAQSTIDSLGGQAANKALEKVDDANIAQNTSSMGSVFQGPFGVFNASPCKTMPSDSKESTPCPTGPKNSRLAVPWQHTAISQVDEAHPSLGTPQSFIYSPHDRGLLLSRNESSTPEAGAMVSSSDNQIEQSASLPSLEHDITPISFFVPVTPRASHVIPEQAAELLRYFKHQVGSLSFPLKGNKRCPWQTIHLPRAEKAYAEILLHETTSNTGFALFYSILSGSCFHRSSRKDPAINWVKHGKEYKQLSRHYLELSIQEEMALITQVKYKELLMALLSNVMLEITSENYSDAQNLLVESECLIRNRGLSKAQKSPKVRTLHHVYTYTRIMAESTCGCALLDICPTRPSSRLASNETFFESLRSFRLADDSTTSDLNAAVEKSFDTGCNDIHLEMLGVWKESLFQEIYGLPESLLGLLSQTIRLANEQELLHRDTSVNIDIVLSLSKRTKILEHQVLSWKAALEIPGSGEVNSSEIDANHAKASATYYPSLAVHQGLILFYYRRMHNMNALILQDTVRKVLDFIKKSEESGMATEQCRASLLWPAFIAACEALEPDLQARLLDWITSTGQSTSIHAFTAAGDVVRRVWKMRQETMDYTISWFNVLDHDRCPIIAI